MLIRLCVTLEQGSWMRLPVPWPGIASSINLWLVSHSSLLPRQLLAFIQTATCYSNFLHILQHCEDEFRCSIAHFKLSSLIGGQATLKGPPTSYTMLHWTDVGRGGSGKLFPWNYSDWFILISKQCTMHSLHSSYREQGLFLSCCIRLR